MHPSTPSGHAADRLVGRSDVLNDGVWGEFEDQLTNPQRNGNGPGGATFLPSLAQTPIPPCPRGLPAASATSMPVSFTPCPSSPLAGDTLLAGTTGGPVIGTVWNPSIRHSICFFPSADADYLLFAAQPANIPIAPGFELLLAPATIFGSRVQPPGTEFLLPIVHDCALAGITFYVQGATVRGGLGWNGLNLGLTNALEVRIGVY